jgi:hypothetical protein
MWTLENLGCHAQGLHLYRKCWRRLHPGTAALIHPVQGGTPAFIQLEFSAAHLADALLTASSREDGDSKQLAMVAPARRIFLNRGHSVPGGAQIPGISCVQYTVSHRTFWGSLMHTRAHPGAAVFTAPHGYASTRCCHVHLLGSIPWQQCSQKTAALCRDRSPQSHLPGTPLGRRVYLQGCHPGPVSSTHARVCQPQPVCFVPDTSE